MDSHLNSIAALERAILEMPDATYWKITERRPGGDHPGVCWQVDPELNEAVCYKGTSQQPLRSEYLHSKVVLVPNETNGLAKVTYFDILHGHRGNSRKLSLLLHDRRIGSVAGDDIRKFEEALADLQQGAANV